MKAGGSTLNRSSFSTSPRPVVVSWILVGIALFLVLHLHLLSALLAGLLGAKPQLLLFWTVTEALAVDAVR